MYKDDIIARPNFQKNKNPLNAEQTQRGILHFTLPCPYCDKIIPIRVQVTNVEIMVAVPKKEVRGS